MPEIRITFEEVNVKAAQIRAHNENLTQTLMNIKTVINNLEAQWTSDTSDTIRAKITAMQPKFDNYKQVIESYAKFLNSTVSQYQTTESALNTNAGQFI